MSTTSIEPTTAADAQGVLIERLEKLFRPLAVLIVVAAVTTIVTYAQRRAEPELRVAPPARAASVAPLDAQWTQPRPATSFDNMYRSR